MFIEYFFGTLAFATSIIGLFPQVYKAITTRSTRDVSMLMLANYFICSFAWIVYGFYTNSLFVLYSNVIGLLSSLTLILLKKSYDKEIFSDEGLQ